MNEFKNIRTGNDLYKFINSLLKENSNLPELSDYLISLWIVSQEYADKMEFQYSDMAYMLQSAFSSIQRINIDWNKEIGKPYNDEQKTISNSPEYYEEHRSYDYFCRYIKNMVVDLLRMKQGLPQYMHWENLRLPDFLEVASWSIRLLTKENVRDWGNMSSLLHAGQYDE
jgi:hypothetical protein